MCLCVRPVALFTPPGLPCSQAGAGIIVAPPSSVVKCLWEVFIWGFGVLFLSCVCGRCRGCCSLSVCVCGLFLLIFFYRPGRASGASGAASSALFTPPGFIHTSRRPVDTCVPVHSVIQMSTPLQTRPSPPALVFPPKNNRTVNRAASASAIVPRATLTPVHISSFIYLHLLGCLIHRPEPASGASGAASSGRC